MIRYLPVLALVLTAIGCQHGSEFQARNLGTKVNGEPAVSLSRARSGSSSRPQILEAVVLPGRGMNIYQIRAWLPGKGEIGLLFSPPVEQAPKVMPDSLAADPFGNASFGYGGAILAPFANRIRGRLSGDGKSIETMIGGHPVALPANFHGKSPGAEVHSMHGLILRSPFTAIRLAAGNSEASATGTLDAADFGGHWPSQTRLTVKAVLRDNSFGFTVTANNVGDEILPVGIGWHPYFVLPSGKRDQARLRIPAEQRALTDNYDNVFPTGQVVPVAGTEYDFAGLAGAPLGKLFLDDCFLTIEKDARGRAVAEIIDPAARYGLRITSLSPQITAYQVYAPVDKAFIALEPQFNRADPFSHIWNSNNTGMAMLKPGATVTYAVELELFVP
ncbi:MAG: aldose 1-epimerase [Bryobacterales bacterium]|nr:aldose 1-epimerase [Bryobacterales bacterium]